MKKAMNLTILSGRGVSQMEAVEKIARAGFDGCFWVAEKETQLQSVVRAVRAAGMQMQFIHAPVRGVDRMWMEDGDAQLQSLTEWMQQCADAGVPYMVCHVWTKFASVEPGNPGIERFGTLLSRAEQLGIKIAFENAEVGKFLLAVRQQLWDSPAAGFCFDTGHEQCYSDGEDQLALFGDKLLCTHLNDNLGRTGPAVTPDDDAHMMPFDGIVDWAGVAARLKKCHFEDFLTFELKMQNKPGRHTHDRYEALSSEQILKLAMEKALQFERLMES